MTFFKRRRTKVLAAVISAVFATVFATPAVHAASTTEITVLRDTSGTDQLITDGLAAAFMKANPDITVTVDYRPGGIDGDNLLKTRLATGDMDDVFLYNRGSTEDQLAQLWAVVFCITKLSTKSWV